MKKDQLTVGIIGAGCRGSNLTTELVVLFDQVKIKYICDRYDDRVEATANTVFEKKGYKPQTITDYHVILNDPEIDVVMNYSSWETHIPVAIESMKAGKICAFEVGGAFSVEQCWELVKTYEETGVPCMMMENCCYDKRETMILNMVRKGLFGEIIHCEGGYRHDLREEISSGIENRHYRLMQYLSRNCDNYPTHELGPIAKILDINRGNRMVSMMSVASKSAGLKTYIQKARPNDENLKTVEFMQGDVITTLIKCAHGETIRLTLDTTLPRYYSRDFIVCGTKGHYTECSDALFLDDGTCDHNQMGEQIFGSAVKYEDEYLSPTWKEYKNNTIGTHGGMDYLIHKAFFNAVLNGDKEMPVDVYDAASWMVITALSEQSIASGSQWMAIPDFTNGAWLSRPRYDVEVLD